MTSQRRVKRKQVRIQDTIGSKASFKVVVSANPLDLASDSFAFSSSVFKCSGFGVNFLTFFGATGFTCSDNEIQKKRN